MTTTKVIARLVEFGPPAIAAYARVRARCVLATAVGLDVLTAFGIDAAPLAVVVDLANRRYVEGITRGEHPTSAVAAGGHLMSCAAPSDIDPAKEWAGHLVIAVPRIAAILDLDLQQFRRPLHHIHLPAAALFSWPRGTTAHEYVRADGTRLCYRQLDDARFRESGDWMYADRRRAIVDRLTRAIRAGHLWRVA